MSGTHGATVGPSRMTGRRATRQPVALVLVAVLMSSAACSAEGYGSVEATPMPSVAGGASQSSGPAATPAPGGRPALPAGFPVPAGAVAEQPPDDDPSIVARWMLEAVGSGPYDYYLEALPAAGYPVVGRYPADQAALVRFEVAPGTIWQLLVEHLGGGTRVTVQLDRP